MAKKKFTKESLKKSFKKYSPAIAIVVFVGALDFLGLVDVKGKALDIVTSRAGSKAVDSADGKNLDKFKKPDTCPDQYQWGAPRQIDENIASRALYYCGVRYAQQYDPIYKVPMWSHEIVTKRDLEIPHLAPLLNAPIENDNFPSKMQAHADLSDYAGSKYSPVFLAPMDNMRIDDVNENFETRMQRSKLAIQESAYMTNSVPMDTTVRDKIWRPLETFTKENAIIYNRVYSISGPLFLGGQTLGTLGDSKISIPTHFFKIITEPDNHETLGYIIPNNAADACPGGQCNFQRFSVSLQEIEKHVGYEFYPRLSPYYAAQVRKDPNEILRKKQQELADKMKNAVK